MLTTNYNFKNHHQIVTIAVVHLYIFFNSKILTIPEVIFNYLPKTFRLFRRNAVRFCTRIAGLGLTTGLFGVIFSDSPKTIISRVYLTILMNNFNILVLYWIILIYIKV